MDLKMARIHQRCYSLLRWQDDHTIRKVEVLSLELDWTGLSLDQDAAQSESKFWVGLDFRLRNVPLNPPSNLSSTIVTITLGNIIWESVVGLGYFRYGMDIGVEMKFVYFLYQFWNYLAFSWSFKAQKEFNFDIHLLTIQKWVIFWWKSAPTDTFLKISCLVKSHNKIYYQNLLVSTLFYYTLTLALICCKMVLKLLMATNVGEYQCWGWALVRKSNNKAVDKQDRCQTENLNSEQTLLLLSLQGWKRDMSKDLVN